MKLRHFALSLALFGATVTVSLNAQTDTYVDQLPAEEEMAEGSWACELERKIFGYKYYFCDCKVGLLRKIKSQHTMLIKCYRMAVDLVILTHIKHFKSTYLAK